MFNSGDVLKLIDLARAKMKDDIYESLINEITAAQHDLVVAEASASRKKMAALIKSIAQLDFSINMCQKKFDLINDNLNDEMRKIMIAIISQFKHQRDLLALEKRKGIKRNV